MPSQPMAVTVVESTKTSLAVAWRTTPPTQGLAGTITGYCLYMDNGFNEDF